MLSQVMRRRTKPEVKDMHKVVGFEKRKVGGSRGDTNGDRLVWRA
jgi:hypothetical protein